jgi:ABC-type branched-subunit amino acid transport system ATPase component
MNPAELPGVEVDNLTVRYGGKTAVDGLSLAAPQGRITGLIGPNGAGKTTTFGAVSGLVPASAGTVRLFGQEVSRRSAAARARLGLGRTFQRTELCPSLTVMDNVALGCEALAAGGNLWRQIVARRHDTARVRKQAAQALDVCGITELSGMPVAALSMGQRRLVELARVHAGGYRMLLLDEPSSGLDPAETARFGAIVRRLVDEGGVGVLLVEHDMTLVMEICDFLYTLDFGRLIFAGTAAETRSSAAVRAAYLGDDDAALQAVEP